MLPRARVKINFRNPPKPYQIGAYCVLPRVCIPDSDQLVLYVLRCRVPLAPHLHRPTHKHICVMEGGSVKEADGLCRDALGVEHVKIGRF